MFDLKGFLEENSIRYRENEPMRLHTSFRIGGDASLFIEPLSPSELALIVEKCCENKIEYFVLGNGSNLLVSDDGITKPVIHLGRGFDSIEMPDETTIVAKAGASLSALCKYALSKELTGLEFAYGIPGTVGGAAFMNAGAYGGEMKDVVYSCSHIDYRGNFGSLKEERLDFGYRRSAYSENGFIITDVTFKLCKGHKDEIESRMNELLQKRIDKQPLNYPSAGSVFKRPEGYFAGELIERSGLKGKTIGGAAVSKKHAGFIVNVGNATCSDVAALIEFCRDTVFEKFGVTLETEIKRI